MRSDDNFNFLLGLIEYIAVVVISLRLTVTSRSVCSHSNSLYNYALGISHCSKVDGGHNGLFMLDFFLNSATTTTTTDTTTTTIRPLTDRPPRFVTTISRPAHRDSSSVPVQTDRLPTSDGKQYQQLNCRRLTLGRKEVLLVSKRQWRPLSQ